MFTTAVDTASAHCSPFFLVLLFIITIQLFCWLSPPLGNKITDAGVLLYTPRQHQDVVPRRKQHSPFSPSLLFNRKKKGCEPSQRDGQMVFPYRIHPFCLLPNSSFRSFHQCRVVFPGIMSHGNLHPYQVSQGTLTAYSTVFQYSQRFIWLDLAVHMRMWWSGRAESLLTGTKCELVPLYFTFYFHIGAMMNVSCLSFP